jgi:putative ABC transport system ATP-binding protein
MCGEQAGRGGFPVSRVPEGGKDYVVRTEDLHKSFRLPSGEVHALRGVNFSVERGRMVAIMGPSGSGKTTLLNLIGALDRPSKGRILIDGQDLTRMGGRQVTSLRRDKLGFIFQSYNLIPVLSAFENVELPMIISGVPRKERSRRVMELLDMVSLSDRANHQPDELSGGEQQRVAIARALANHPSIILADEPTGDLDTRTGEEVMGVLREASQREGATVIVVTHNPSISRLTDRVFFMEDGRIVGEGRGDRLVRLIGEPRPEPPLVEGKPLDLSHSAARPGELEDVPRDLPIPRMGPAPQPIPEVGLRSEAAKKITRVVEWRGDRRMIRDSKGIICLKCGAYNFGEGVRVCRICGGVFAEPDPVVVSVKE